MFPAEVKPCGHSMAVWLHAHSGDTGTIGGVALECRSTAGLGKVLRIIPMWLTMWPQTRDLGFLIHTGYSRPNNKPRCSSLLSVANDETLEESQPGGKGLLHLTDRREGESRQERKQGPQRNTFFPGLFSWLVLLPFLDSRGSSA